MIFNLHSDILCLFAENKTAWQDTYQPLFAKGESYGGIWVPWIKEPYRNSREGTLAQWEFINNYINGEFLPAGIACVKSYTEYEKAVSKGLYPVFLGIEGLDFLTQFSAEDFYQQGYRHAMLTWSHGNAYGAGNSEPNDKGLTNAGRSFLRDMEKLGMLIDVSHLNEKSFWEVCESVDSPFMASHSNVYALCPHNRNLKDEQIKEISRRGGRIGLSLINKFISSEPSLQNFDTFKKHILYIMELTGDENVLCFGLDWCSFLNPEFKVTKGYHDPSDGVKFPMLLKEIGLSQETSQKICCQNALDYLKKMLS